MPYIEQYKRDCVDRSFGQDNMPERYPEDAGELAYTVTRECMGFLENQPRRGFLAFATMIGVLICVVLELYRRIVAPYEDLAKVRNGDVEGLNR